MLLSGEKGNGHDNWWHEHEWLVFAAANKSIYAVVYCFIWEIELN